ncbi:hypothetical protein ACFL16_00795 [Patescibacteria group bacterium]
MIQNTKYKIQDTKKGYITLLSILVIGSVGVVITTSLLLLGLGSSRTSFSLEQSVQTKAVVNACAEEALQVIQDNNPYTGTDTVTIGQGSCTYTVTSGGGGNRDVTVLGTVGTITRKVEIAIDAINPTINVTSWQEVDNL